MRPTDYMRMLRFLNIKIKSVGGGPTDLILVFRKLEKLTLLITN